MAKQKLFCYSFPMCSHPVPASLFLRGPVHLSHLLLRSLVRPGDQAIDATCGNGNDTLLLAELVGNQGSVWSFDIQKQAFATTSARLTEAGYEQRVTLVKAGHEELESRVTGPVQAIVFNLGYLPGGDHSIITTPATTLPALHQACNLLAPGGATIITLYPGHGGGDNETEQVTAWAATLPQNRFHCWQMKQPNTSAQAPFLLTIQKAR